MDRLNKVRDDFLYNINVIALVPGKFRTRRDIDNGNGYG